jgi:hypothetical protein
VGNYTLKATVVDQAGIRFTTNSVALGDDPGEDQQAIEVRDTDVPSVISDTQPPTIAIGYNPTKPSRPSHLLHTFLVSNLRLVRGDSGYGNEGILLTLEEHQQPYLLRLRQTKNVQRLVAQQFARQDWSRPDSQGCQMVEAQLQLHG